MNHTLLVTIHLLAAIAFGGTVFFEVMVLSHAQSSLPMRMRPQLEQAIGNRAVRIFPFVLLVLYGAGLAMAWQFRGALAHPFSTSFGAILTLKIVLALSVLAHFFTAMFWRRRGKLSGTRSHALHLSIFCHIIVIVILAKALYIA